MQGTVVWFLWGGIINFVVLAERYAAAQQAGVFLQEPRYPSFPGVWTLMLFAISYGLAGCMQELAVRLDQGRKQP